MVYLFMDLKGVFPFKPLPTNNASMSTHFRMFGQMISEVCLLSEAMTTHFTHKWLVASVHLLVY